MSVSHLKVKALVAAMLLAPTLPWAQSVPIDPPASTAVGALPRELGKPEDDLVLDVRRYQIDGVAPEVAARMAAVTAPYVGQARHYEDLMNAVAAVSQYLQRDMGYYVGFAYLPEQQMQDGVVHIQALEGRLDQVRVNGSDDLPVRREVLDRYLAQLQPGSILQVEALERVVLLSNDLQGVKLRFEVEPGRTPGTASLVVTPEPERRFSGQVAADTLGSRYTGVGRLSGQFNWRSPTGAGDLLGLGVLGSTTRGLSMVTANYVAPVHVSGIKLGGALSQVRYQLDRDMFDWNLHGRAWAGNIFALAPVVRSRNLNAFGVLSYERKHFEDHAEIFGWDNLVQKTSDDVQLSVMGDFRDTLGGGGLSTYELSYLWGHMQFDTGESGMGIDQRTFNKSTLALSRLQNIVNGRLMLYARYKRQFANDNLDPTERFALGGPQGVRAFSPGEAAVDDGQVISAELRFLPPGSWFGPVSRELMFNLFYDWGHGKISHTGDSLPWGERNQVVLGGWGLGATWDRPGDFSVRLDLAWRNIGEGQPAVNRQEPRANAVLTKQF